MTVEELIGALQRWRSWVKVYCDNSEGEREIRAVGGISLYKDGIRIHSVSWPNESEEEANG